MLNIILVLSLVFALLVAIFAIQNNTVVDISFWKWTFSNISLVLIIIGAAVAGAVSVFFLGLFKQIKLKMEMRQLKHSNTRLKNDVERLEAALEEERQGQGEQLGESEQDNLEQDTGEKDKN